MKRYRKRLKTSSSRWTLLARQPFILRLMKLQEELLKKKWQTERISLPMRDYMI